MVPSIKDSLLQHKNARVHITSVSFQSIFKLSQRHLIFFLDDLRRWAPGAGDDFENNTRSKPEHCLGYTSVLIDIVILQIVPEKDAMNDSGKELAAGSPHQLKKTDIFQSFRFLNACKIRYQEPQRKENQKP